MFSPFRLLHFTLLSNLFSAGSCFLDNYFGGLWYIWELFRQKTVFYKFIWGCLKKKHGNISLSEGKLSLVEQRILVLLVWLQESMFGQPIRFAWVHALNREIVFYWLEMYSRTSLNLLIMYRPYTCLNDGSLIISALKFDNLDLVQVALIPWSCIVSGWSRKRVL